jgi:hypothetical protein
LQALQASVRLLHRTLAACSARVGGLPRGLAGADNVEAILDRLNTSHINGNVCPISDLLRFVEFIDELVDLIYTNLACIVFVEYFEH